MKTKTTILILLALSIIPILKGFDNSASIIYRHLLMQEGTLIWHLQLFNLSSFLALSIGLLIGGLAIDKWNFKKLVLIDLIGLSVFSTIIQFNDSYLFVITQRFILGFSLGFLLIGFKVFLCQIAEPKHRGKLLYAFINASIIGTLIYHIVFSYFDMNIVFPSLSYAQFQSPFIVLPWMVLLIKRYLPDSNKSESDKSYTIGYFFKPGQKILILVMFVLAILLSFANSSLMVSQLAMDTNNEYAHINPTLTWLLAFVFGVFTIDYFGRKGLLKFGISALIVCAVLILVISFVTNYQMITSALIYLYNFLFIYTISTTSTIIILEYLPSPIRGRGMVLFAFICWIPTTINFTFIYPSFFNSEHKLTILSVISLIALVSSLILIRKRLIETTGLSFEEIKDKSITSSKGL
jgi:MFS family permease